jgi:hypothetical protein
MAGSAEGLSRTDEPTTLRDGAVTISGWMQIASASGFLGEIMSEIERYPNQAALGPYHEGFVKGCLDAYVRAPFGIRFT